MTIPHEVLTFTMYAENYCHSATLKRGNKEYIVTSEYDHNDCRIVKATIEIALKSKKEQYNYKKDGYSILNNGTIARKKIKLSQVPTSQADEWKCVDEY